MRIAIVVLVLLVLLFVVAVGSGACRQQNSTSAGWLDALKSAVGEPPPVAPGDISASAGSCLQNGQLVVQQLVPCRYEIAASSQNARRVKITSGTATVLLAPKKLVGGKKTLTAGSSDDHIDVYSDGASLLVTCMTASCRLR